MRNCQWGYSHLAHILCELLYHDLLTVGGCNGKCSLLVCTAALPPPFDNPSVVTVEYDVLALA